MDERDPRDPPAASAGPGAVVAGSSFPEGGNGMRIDRQGDAARRRQAPETLDEAKLARVKGGLKADRVQGSDPSLPGGN
jgi:hypothetical protein